VQQVQGGGRRGSGQGAQEAERCRRGADAAGEGAQVVQQVGLRLLVGQVDLALQVAEAEGQQATYVCHTHCVGGWGHVSLANGWRLISALLGGNMQH
jgi:hypothetical protein